MRNYIVTRPQVTENAEVIILCVVAPLSRRFDQAQGERVGAARGDRLASL